jgi:hypothetical protein
MTAAEILEAVREALRREQAAMLECGRRVAGLRDVERILVELEADGAPSQGDGHQPASSEPPAKPPASSRRRAARSGAKTSSGPSRTTGGRGRGATPRPRPARAANDRVRDRVIEYLREHGPSRQATMRDALGVDGGGLSVEVRKLATAGEVVAAGKKDRSPVWALPGNGASPATPPASPEPPLRRTRQSPTRDGAIMGALQLPRTASDLARTLERPLDEVLKDLRRLEGEGDVQRRPDGDWVAKP